MNPTRDFTPISTPADMSLDLGGFVGSKVIRLAKIISMGLADAADPSSKPEFSSPRHTTWYPYKLELEATYAGGAMLSGCDFFIDDDSNRENLASGATGDAYWQLGKQREFEPLHDRLIPILV